MIAPPASPPSSAEPKPPSSPEVKPQDASAAPPSPMPKVVRVVEDHDPPPVELPKPAVEPPKPVPAVEAVPAAPPVPKAAEPVPPAVMPVAPTPAAAPAAHKAADPVSTVVVPVAMEPAAAVAIVEEAPPVKQNTPKAVPKPENVVMTPLPVKSATTAAPKEPVPAPAVIITRATLPTAEPVVTDKVVIVEDKKKSATAASAPVTSAIEIKPAASDTAGSAVKLEQKKIDGVPAVKITPVAATVVEVKPVPVPEPAVKVEEIKAAPVIMTTPTVVMSQPARNSSTGTIVIEPHKRRHRIRRFLSHQHMHAKLEEVRVQIEAQEAIVLGMRRDLHRTMREETGEERRRKLGEIVVQGQQDHEAVTVVDVGRRRTRMGRFKEWLVRRRIRKERIVLEKTRDKPEVVLSV